MSRRPRSTKRVVPPDPRYDSQTVSKFMNNLMKVGKKSTAEGIFYGAMDIIEQRTGQPGVNVFKQALSNAKPVVEVKSRRVGGATYQVPVEVRPDRRTALAMRCVSSFFLIDSPSPFEARITSAANRSDIVFSRRDRLYWINHRMPSAVRRSGRTSTGTW